MRRRSRGSGGFVSRRKLLLGVGAALTGAGLTSTAAYDSVEANRGTTISTTADPSALLGLDNYSTTDTTTITNNSNGPMDVTLDSPESVEFDVGTNGTSVAPPVTFSLASGATKEVGITFTGQCTNAGSATVSSDATLKDGSGNTEGTISLTREWKIPASGQVQFNGSASSAGSSGKYEFTLENTGCEDVTFVGIGIKETTTDADFVSGGGSLFDNNTELVTNSIPIDNSNPDSDTRRDLNQTVTLSVNNTVTWEFDKFRRNGQGKPNVDMRGEDVKIRLYLSDGSTATEKLCLGTCDF